MEIVRKRLEAVGFKNFTVLEGILHTTSTNQTNKPVFIQMIWALEHYYSTT